MIKITAPNVAHIVEQTKKVMTNYLGDTGARIMVGVHESAGAKDGSDLTVAQVAAYNHFGTKTKAGTTHIPARPFLDVGVLSQTDRYEQIIKDSGGKDLDAALELVGLVAVGAVQNYITELSEPANNDATIKAKGSSNPLIDTGQLKQSITFSVTREAVTEGL